MSSYTWNFGSGNGSSVQNSNATNPSNLSYSLSGVQTITLTGVSSDGCLNTITHTVDVYASPTASFTANGVCSGAATTFTDNSTPVAPSTGAVTSWDWDFDNNGTTDNTSQNPSNSYAAAGNYTTALIVTSANGCKDTIRKTINVWGRAVPNFTPSGVCFNSATTFTNLTSTSVNPNTGSASSYTWNFGNGGSSTQTSPVYTYTNVANATTNTNYNATLFVTTSNGCTDSITKVVTVYSLPTPDFKADSVCFGSPTTLQDISNANGNPFLFFRWDWDNDGNPEVTNNSLSTQNTFTTWGSIPINYTVITSPNGGLLNCWSSVSKNIWVHPSPVAAFSTGNKCIDAQPVQVNAGGSSIPVGTITGYDWTFGDGSSSIANTNAASTHSYNTPGIYVITLTVSSANGCSNTTTNSVEVYDKPYGTFVYSKTCFNQTTTLTAIPSATGGVVTNYDWDFNNTPQTVEAIGAQVTTTFAAAGQQTLNLVLTSDKGCKNVVPGNVYINYNPEARFYAPKRMGCTDLCITIMDSVSTVPGPAQVINWDWDFGNGSTWNAGNNGSNLVCYRNSSNYNLKKYDVRLIVRTDSGCVDTMVRKNYIVVYPKPVADFTWAGEDGDILTPVIAFTNTSQGYTNFQWYWNDALNALDSVHNNPKHYFATDEPKSVNVYLAVRNSYGCKDTVMKPIEIGGNFTFYIPNCFTPNGDGLNDTFQGTGIGIKEYKMWIFDRWGEMIYYTNDIKKGWDGSVKKHATDGKQDVYQWKVIVIDLNSKAHHYVGHVTQLPD
jgi:gliding motility-associated-like protein